MPKMMPNFQHEDFLDVVNWLCSLIDPYIFSVESVTHVSYYDTKNVSHSQWNLKIVCDLVSQIVTLKSVNELSHLKVSQIVTPQAKMVPVRIILE